MSIEERKERARKLMIQYIDNNEINQKDVAEEVGLNKDYFNRLLKERCNFSRGSLVLFEDFFKKHHIGE